MKRTPLLVALSALLAFSAVEARADVCENHTARYEAAYGIPAHLLTAVARAESGRADATTGAVRAWPWTVTSPEGDVKYATKWEAISAVRDLQRRGVANIDVGCMQVNLLHHPQAFGSLNLAFDPETNVAYAARLLTEHFARTGDWRMAVAHYHSTTPDLYRPYQARVEDLWQQAREEAPRTSTVADAGWDDDARWWADRSWSRWSDWRSRRDASGHRFVDRWGHVTFWYGDVHPGAGGPSYPVTHTGPWRPVGTNR